LRLLHLLYGFEGDTSHRLPVDRSVEAVPTGFWEFGPSIHGNQDRLTGASAESGRATLFELTREKVTDSRSVCVSQFKHEAESTIREVVGHGQAERNSERRNWWPWELRHEHVRPAASEHVQLSTNGLCAVREDH